MTELFDLLSVAGETVSEEDRVVYLLASLPDDYNVLVTALEANEDVPKLEVITERILHQKRKSKDRNEASSSTERAMTSHRSRELTFCESCTRGKQHRTKFSSSSIRADRRTSSIAAKVQK